VIKFIKVKQILCAFAHTGYKTSIVCKHFFMWQLYHTRHQLY